MSGSDRRSAAARRRELGVWTTTELSVDFDIPVRELIYFCERRVIVPAQDSAGRGKQRLFDRQNRFEILLALELRRYQIDTEKIAILERFVRSAIAVEPRILKECEAWVGRSELVVDEGYLAFMTLSSREVARIDLQRLEDDVEKVLHRSQTKSGRLSITLPIDERSDLLLKKYRTNRVINDPVVRLTVRLSPLAEKAYAEDTRGGSEI